MRSIVFTIIFTMLFLGCATKPVTEVKQEPLPAWISNPPKSDISTLYGVGEGKNRDAAVADALNQIVATLSVYVKSEYNSQTKVKNLNGYETYSQDAEQKISSSVKELRVGNYELVEYKKIGFQRYAVLVKSDKNALFNTLKDEVVTSIQVLESEESANRSANVLEQLRFYEKASSKAEALLYKSMLLKVLRPSFDDSTVVKDLTYFKKSYVVLRSKLSFSVSSDKQSKNLIAVMKDFLTSKGFKIADKKDMYHLNVGIRSDIIFSSAYGFDIARSAIAIEIKDSKQQIVLTKKLDITGQSTQGQNVARQNIAIKFKNSISNFNL